ncbi:hypothetical protein CYY_005435 [Polysphondylium violaceum]|uniref:Uncharacterized protein n=1 Tax=Polysphondylium violaceum TaxID=133409 RepID=A0A8J4PSW8_9MYCE|nr:hypothetical protein CYY_005435 [Polysphondylium violaceum]
MSNKIYMESISYDQENYEKSKKIASAKASHRKTTSALVKNVDATLFDITNNSPPKTPKASVKFTSSSLSPTSSSRQLSSSPNTPAKSTPLKTNSNSTSNNNNNQFNILDNTSLSPKSSRYTIAHTPTKIGSNSSNNSTPTNMMTLTQSQPSPVVSAAKSFFTPTKPTKLKKKQMEKELEMLKDKIRIMEKIRIENDSDVERMKSTLIETLSENDRLSQKVTQLEGTITNLQKELDKGSYDSWKGYCALQDSPPGVSTRYSKKRALSSNVGSVNF